jgi:nucleotide-binding universal stress UspA family protein
MRKLFKKILCPIDFDENSYFALDLARDMAQESDSTIYLLHVVSIAPVPAAGISLEPYPISERDARAKLQQVADEHLAGRVHYEIIIRIGSPADLVNGAIAQLGVDSAVIATHGRKGIARFLLGSVAEKVVREASCPVLVVKAPVQ